MSDSFKHLPLREIEAQIDTTSNMPVAVAHQSETLLTVLYRPRGRDHQEPHDQDEIYVVASGTAVLEVEQERKALGPGDAAFVAAQAQHRFLDISDDFVVWAVFPKQ